MPATDQVVGPIRALARAVDADYTRVGHVGCPVDTSSAVWDSFQPGIR